MNWTCIDDRRVLLVEAEALVCPGCGRRYALVEGIPLFTGGAPDSHAAPPLLEEIWRQLEERPAGDAARELCARHGCSRHRQSSAWKLFLDPPPDGAILEIGPGFGDDSADLAARAGSAVLLVPNLLNGRIVQRRLAQCAPGVTSIAVAPDLTRLPLADRSMAAVVLEDATARAFGLTRRSLPAIAAEWRRVLEPRGTLLLGLGNPFERLPGWRALRAYLSRARPESLNRLVKRAGSGSAHGRLGLKATVRELRRQGFGAPTIYAPLPDERHTQIVVPADNRQALRYFLNNMVRRNSRAVDAVVPLADLLIRLGLFRHFLPYYYVVFKAEERSRGDGRVMGTVTICVERPDSEEARDLLRQLDDDLLRRYPAQAIHGFHPRDVTDLDLTFLVARIDGRIAGCGALRGLAPGAGEVKRMFVLPEFRGRGIARRILAALESRARELGHASVRLETGSRQPEALGLYRSAGYVEIAPFGEYTDNPLSVCFEKRLL